MTCTVDSFLRLKVATTWLKSSLTTISMSMDSLVDLCTRLHQCRLSVGTKIGKSVRCVNVLHVIPSTQLVTIVRTVAVRNSSMQMLRKKYLRNLLCDFTILTRTVRAMTRPITRRPRHSLRQVRKFRIIRYANCPLYLVPV